MQSLNYFVNSSKLIAYIYDVPLSEGYTGIELSKILNDLGCRCDVQVNHNKSITKPYLTARAKFESEA